MHYSTSIGLDVHARSISASAFVWETGEVVSREFAYAPEEVAEWARSLPQPTGCLYESGPTGFDLKRRLDALGVPCHVGAVTKMVRPSGDRVKTDRRDARFLSRLLAVGEFVECWVSPTALEAARDLPRAREDARQGLMRARHQLSKLLLRHGLVWPRGRAAWTKGHRRWLRSIELPDPHGPARARRLRREGQGVRGEEGPARRRHRQEGRGAGRRADRPQARVPARRVARDGLRAGLGGGRLLALPHGPVVHVLRGARALGVLVGEVVLQGPHHEGGQRAREAAARGERLATTRGRSRRRRSRCGCRLMCPPRRRSSPAGPTAGCTRGRSA